MAQYTIKVSTPSAESLRIRYTPDDLMAITTTAERQLRERLARGENVNDRKAKDLTKRYAAYKQRRQRGAAPIRNLRLTGKTLANMKSSNFTETHGEIGFTDGEAIKRMLYNQNIDPGFGLSPNDMGPTMAVANEVLAAKFNK